MNKTRFKLTQKRTPKAGLEAHLVAVAQAWTEGKNDVSLNSLTDFYTFLNREKTWYLNDHPRIRSTSVSIILMQDEVIYIKPGNGFAGAQTADIRLVQEPVTEAVS